MYKFSCIVVRGDSTPFVRTCSATRMAETDGQTVRHLTSAFQMQQSCNAEPHYRITAFVETENKRQSINQSISSDLWDWRLSPRLSFCIKLLGYLFLVGNQRFRTNISPETLVSYQEWRRVITQKLLYNPDLFQHTVLAFAWRKN